jgi:predicted glycogen debranching enzyme
MDLTAEWLETNGMQGFASGTVSGKRTRRYHGLLLVSTSAGRTMLVNGVDVWLETPTGTFGLSTQAYPDGILEPNGEQHIASFQIDPWPKWRFETASGHIIDQECLMPHEEAAIVLRWRMVAGHGPVKLHVKPFLSGRDYHFLHHKNPDFRFDAAINAECVTWQPYGNRPKVLARSNGEFTPGRRWYENFFYAEEAERGLDTREDLAVPGEFHCDLSARDACLIFAADVGDSVGKVQAAASVESLAAKWADQERQRRESLGTPLEQAADQYLVRRGTSRTIIAGYPWFTDWGRDTFIALRGLCQATGRLDVAEEILCSWAGTVSEGMLPNRFPDHGESPEYNSVDASLWYVVAVGEFVEECQRRSYSLSTKTKATLKNAISQILKGYREGTRYKIGMDKDGLIAAGVPGVQLTWMDAKVGDWVVTPRIGKPVEIQALWTNALTIGYDLIADGVSLYEQALESFRQKFWNENRRCLYDVIDCDHEPGKVDPAIRPNQVFAVGGLPEALLDGERAKRVVDTVETHLYTPLGLRSLSPDDAGYRASYCGGVWDRDGAYHQGTVWCWLIGPFVEGWVNIRENSPAVRKAARERFLKPLQDHLQTAGLGHISEIADASGPHTPRGCPFQAWSLGEFLRLDRKVLVEKASERGA